MSIYFHLCRRNVTCHTFNIVLSLTGSFTNAKEHFGRLNIVVNNAGVMGETDWERTLDINLVLYLNYSHLKPIYTKAVRNCSYPRQPKIPFVKLLLTKKASIPSFLKSYYVSKPCSKT